MIWFLSNVVALSSLVIAGMLAVLGKEGWGWFLFTTILLAAYPTSKESTKRGSNGVG